MDKKVYTKVYNGNIKIVDPNKTIDDDGVVEDRYVAPEDLMMYLNIKARVNPRSKILYADGEDQLVDIATIKSVNFLKPSGKDGFTTDWTEMFSNNDITTDLEGFSVENVSVKFNASLAPEITVDFVDIRGQNLFIKGDQPDSPYNLFFSFPYPIFFLTMKGYYGKAIQIPMAMVKTNTRFDGGTGNYITTCEFNSWTFGFFNDFNLSYLFVTPYMYRLDSGDFEGKKYLEKVYERNKLYLSDGNTLDPVCTGIYTMADLVYGISDIENSFKNKNPAFVTYKEQYAKLSEINNRLIILENTTTSAFDELELSSGGPDRLQPNNEIYDAIEEQVDELRSNSTFKTILTKAKVNDSQSRKFINRDTFIRSAALGTVTLDEFTRIIGELRIAIDSSLKTLQETISDQIDETVDEILGFTPNMRNIIYIISCNLQAFIDLLIDKSKLALEQCREAQRTNNSRRNNQLNNGEYDILDGEPRFYPWPDYYKTALNADVAPERVIPSENVQNRDWEEVKFIDELILAVARLEEAMGARYTSTPSSSNPLNLVSVFDIDGTLENDYNQLVFDDVILNATQNAQDLIYGGGLITNKISDTDYAELLTLMGLYDGKNLARSMKEQNTNKLDFTLMSLIKNTFKTNGYNNIKERLLRGINTSTYESKLLEYGLADNDGVKARLERELLNLESTSTSSALWKLLKLDNRPKAQSIYTEANIDSALNEDIIGPIPADNVISDDNTKYSDKRKNVNMLDEENILFNLNNINMKQVYFENERTNLYNYGNTSDEFNYQPHVPSFLDSDIEHNTMFFSNKFDDGGDDTINPSSFNRVLRDE